MNRKSYLELFALLGSFGLPGAAAAQDFNGDGVADIAIGAPGETVGGAAGAGAVTIIYGAGPGTGLNAFGPLAATQITQATFGFEVPEVGDHFGASLAWGDFDADGFDDLAVGAPDEDLPTGTIDAGLVLVYYGSPAGLAPLHSPYLSQGPGGLPDPDEPDDHLGWSLAAGDFDADGFTDLAIGVPGEDLTATDQGMVHQCFGSPGGLMPVGGAFPMFIQSMVGDPAEIHDRFGFSLAAGQLDGVPGDDLAIGVPFEDFAFKGECGMVNVVYSTPGVGLDPAAVTPPRAWTQNSPGIPNASQLGDHFGWALAIGNFDGDRAEDLAIGVPHEDMGIKGDCGVVNVIYSAGPGIGLDAFAPVAAEIWHQSSPGVPEADDANDWFGYALAAGDFNGDKIDDLAIGVPNEDVGGTTDCGYVNTIYGAGIGFGLDAFGPVAAEGWHQDSAGVPNVKEASDRFGWSLTVGDFDLNGCADLAVGVPYEDLGAVADAGLLNVIYGNPTAGVGLDGILPVGAQQWHQNIAGIPDFNEPGDGFGAALDNDN